MSLYLYLGPYVCIYLYPDVSVSIPVSDGPVAVFWRLGMRLVGAACVCVAAVSGPPGPGPAPAPEAEADVSLPLLSLLPPSQSAPSPTVSTPVLTSPGQHPLSDLRLWSDGDCYQHSGTVCLLQGRRQARELRRPPAAGAAPGSGTRPVCGGLQRSV